MTAFAADPAFDAGSLAVTDWPLCQVRLQDDARFPWLILIPRVPGTVEIEHLSSEDRTRLLDEGLRAGRLIRRMGEALERPVDKLNMAALGNVTAQLHLHVIGRRRDDPVWPDPVWGRGTPQPWTASGREALMAMVRAD
ncbi:HIT domain-containing protein [Brevundimonas sp.]|uniref:HIT domain-containing protein n=1 Tax=Brevundimonas sp. TaxID=1871086 RepID=UPI003514AC64